MISASSHTESHRSDAPAAAGHLGATAILDLAHPTLRSLVDAKGWQGLPARERIGAIYDYVRNEIPFGYNRADDIAASRVLADGYGQCNTKTTLLMALLRIAGIPCRFHGATIDKRLQKGLVTGLFYSLAPQSIFHSWAEVWFEGRWTALEGVILDQRYLTGLRARIPAGTRSLVGFGVGTDDVTNPPVAWRGADTFIQIKGVNQDLGIFADPDSFYAKHGRNLVGIKGLLYEFVVRHLMNRTVATIRQTS